MKYSNLFFLFVLATSCLIMLSSCDRCRNTLCINGYCDDGCCICYEGYEGEKCDQKIPCYNIDCSNNGTCIDDICECDFPYVSTDCSKHIVEVMTGTYLSGTPSEDAIYYISVSGNRTTGEVELVNLDNKGIKFKGKMDEEGEIEFTEWGYGWNYLCDSEEQIGTHIYPINEEKPNELKIHIFSHREYCQGNEVLSSSWGDKTFYRVDNIPCQSIFIGDDCNPPITNFAGTYKYDSDLSRDAPIYDNNGNPIPLNNIRVRASGGKLEFYNLMNDSRWLGATFNGFNQFLFNTRLRLHGDVTGMYAKSQSYRCFFNPTGDYLVFQAYFQSPISSYDIDLEYVYRKQ